MKKVNLFLPVILSLALLQTGNSQINITKKQLEGSWMGSLELGAINLRLVFNIKAHPNDSLSATMDSPDQGAKNIPMNRVSIATDTLVIEARLLQGDYTGHFTSDSTLEGKWTQRGQRFKLNLKKLKTAFVVNRPQEPKPPFQYKSEDISFPNKVFNIYLAGTLTIPAGNGPFPAAVLITGSGAQNRDEAIMGHKPFHVIADWLTKNGIAVLRYDDRGVGKSQGNHAAATSSDLATDAIAAWEYLKTNPLIDQSSIGFIGHSEGGLIAPIAVSTTPGIAFIVSLAGTGVPGDQLLFRQQKDISSLSGISEQEISEGYEINRKIYSIIKKERDNIKAEKKTLAAYSKILAKKNLSAEDNDAALNQVKPIFTPDAYLWFRYFISTDPASFWSKVKCPVLALNGEKDTQVAWDANLPAIEKAVKSSGNNRITTRSFPGLNHLFQHCESGLPAEYGKIEETFSPEVLKIISDWILSLKVSR